MRFFSEVASTVTANMGRLRKKSLLITRASSKRGQSFRGIRMHPKSIADSLRKIPQNACHSVNPDSRRKTSETIENWIQAGAPDWATTSQRGRTFITPKAMLDTIERHVNALSAFDRRFTRYFTMTHLYNAGETNEALRAYQRALSKLVNSLSLGREVIRPKAIDPKQTVFTIDLRDYEWEIGTNRWTQIERAYPYSDAFNAPTETNLQKKLEYLRQTLNCDVPYIQVDWFLATASLPPLYHDMLGLPQTDHQLETRLEVNVAENIRNAPGRRVWRAGFNDSGVSNHNRVVERHASRYGAYWKSYDFAGSTDEAVISFTHPLSFKHDGGEIIFNLPNGLQAYFLVDANGQRLNAAPIKIVSNPAASDPTVRNGLSCIGCHTEGMKEFEDQVRAAVQRTSNPPYNKNRALQLYTDKATMNARVREDTLRYKRALEASGGIFGGIEPVQRFHEAFSRPLDADHAAASVGLQTQTFLTYIRQNVGLQNLGLSVLVDGTIKRDAWTSKYADILLALDFPTRKPQTVDPQEEVIPGAIVHIPDPNLRAAFEDALGKASGLPITAEEMATLEGEFLANNREIRDLRGIQYAVNVWAFRFQHNEISDLSPFARLPDPGVGALSLEQNKISDLSPLARLTHLEWLGLGGNTQITDISPLTRLKQLKGLWLTNSTTVNRYFPDR